MKLLHASHEMRYQFRHAGIKNIIHKPYPGNKKKCPKVHMSSISRVNLLIPIILTKIGLHYKVRKTKCFLRITHKLKNLRHPYA